MSAASRDLESLTAQLSTNLAGLDCTLGGKTIKPPKFSSRGSAIWRSTPMWPQQAPVTGKSAAEGLYSLDPCSTLMNDVGSPWTKARMMMGLPLKATEIVCTMVGAGTQLRDGEVQLTPGDAAAARPETALVLDESCNGVHFRNMKFTGTRRSCLRCSGCSSLSYLA